MKRIENIQIRSACLADVKVLREYEQGVVNAEREFSNSLKSGHVQYYDLQSLIECEQTNLLVAEFCGEIIACGYARLASDEPYLKTQTHAYLGFMYVVPKQRGKGIIQKLVRELLAWARSRGVGNFKLDVYARNQAAINAYAKLGFRAELQEMVMLDD